MLIDYCFKSNQMSLLQFLAPVAKKSDLKKNGSSETQASENLSSLLSPHKQSRSPFGAAKKAKQKSAFDLLEESFNQNAKNLIEDQNNETTLEAGTAIPLEAATASTMKTNPYITDVSQRPVINSIKHSDGYATVQERGKY